MSENLLDPIIDEDQARWKLLESNRSLRDEVTRLQAELETERGFRRRLEASNQALGESEHILRMRLARMHELTALAGF